MKKPEGFFGSLFEFEGVNFPSDLNLANRFWFKCGYGFSNKLSLNDNQTSFFLPQNHYQDILYVFLKKCINNNRLSGQFELENF